MARKTGRLRVELEEVAERRVNDIEPMTGAGPDHHRWEDDSRGGGHLGNSDEQARRIHLAQRPRKRGK